MDCNSEIDFSKAFSSANSIRGALFKLREWLELSADCHVCYEFMLRPNLYKRGDIISRNTFPENIIKAYYNGGAFNADPVLDQEWPEEPAQSRDIRKILNSKDVRYRNNVFFKELLKHNIVLLKTYAITTSVPNGITYLTACLDGSTKFDEKEDAYMAEVAQSFHGFVLEKSLIRDHFSIKEKELQALDLIASGKSADEAALQFRVTRRTIEVWLQSVRKKIFARTTAEAVFKATSYGLIPYKNGSDI